MQDGELYELIGYGWRFPIIVRWGDLDVAEVTLADVPILKKQKLVVEAGLRTHATNSTFNKWYYSRVMLGQVAIKSTFTDPEDVVVWQRPDDPPLESSNFIVSYATEWRYALIKNAYDASHIWNNLCQFMLEWMIPNQRAVDFGFGRLEAFCARANWKNVVIGTLTAQKDNMPGKETSKAQLKKTKALLHQNKMTAWNPDTKTFEWCAEFTPGQAFKEYARIEERKRKRHSSQRRTYIARMLRLLKSPEHEERMYRCLYEYHRETYLQIGLLPHGGPISPKGKGEECAVDPSPAPHWGQTAVVAGATMEGKDGRAFIPPSAQMLSVQDIQSLTENVRLAVDRVDTARQDNPGTTGVPVLDAAQGPNGGELLDVRPVGGHDDGDGLAPAIKQFPDQAEETQTP